MSYIVFFTLLLLITLLGVYVVIENNRKKAREAEKKIFNARLKEVTDNFKAKTAEYVDAKVLRPKYAPKVNAIVGNFFVVQAHTEANLNQLEKISEQFTRAVGTELGKSRVTGNKDQLAEQLQYFVAELPSSGIAYNKDFYYEILPALIALIKTPDVSVDAFDDGQDEEQEGNFEEQDANPRDDQNNQLEQQMAAARQRLTTS
ncbi:hypothetical protein HG263_03445 [Pseudoalteromonas sp. JBTF-M23]|uniref:Uncharacterized protein n=1 Tax=Pseudoalteromonas caenipelagi TaxID=2726988 RepID=A0A849V8Q3_9GAMM|nr:hypothetical protein [Pseudoalteromonas caenipelagi]